MKELTERQKEILVFIKDYINSNSFSPTIRDIATHFNISAKAAHDHVTALKNKNAITQNDRQSRTMVLTSSLKEDNDPMIKVPIVGTVAAGVPILSEENWEGTISLPPSMLKKNKTYFALNIRGDSMIGAGINEGDIAVIEKQSVANNGDIVVAVTNNALTIKRFYRKKSKIMLKPENPKYKPEYYYDLRIVGRLSRIIRYY